MLWAASILVGVGVCLLTFTLGRYLPLIWERTRILTRSRAERDILRYQRGESDLPDHVLYGYPDLPWRTMGMVLAAIGCLLILVTAGPRYALVAVVLERAPWLARRLLRSEGKQRLRLHARDFVDDLREAFAIHGSLGRALSALADVAGQAGRKDAVSVALLRRAQGLSVQTPAEQVLDQLADDLRSADVRQVADHVRLALAGGMEMGEALEAVAATLSETIAAEVNVRLQAAANVYVLPMVILTFGPLMAIGLFPLVLRITALLAGAP
jgi:hypothetical protein